MSQTMSNVYSERFSVGGVIGAAFSIYGKYFLFITALVAIVTSPVILFKFYGHNLGFTDRLTIQLVGVCIQILSQGLLVSLSMYIVVTHLRGQHPTLADTLVKGLGRVIFAIGTLILIIVIAAVLLFIFGTISSVAVRGGVHPLLIAGIFLIVAAILYCYWFVAVASSTIERTNPFKALYRSAYLTRGYRWQIFALLVLYFLVAFGIGYAIATILKPTDVFSLKARIEFQQNLAISSYIIQIILSSLVAVGTAYSYYVLSNEKDGVGVDEIAKVFE